MRLIKYLLLSSIITIFSTKLLAQSLRDSLITINYDFYIDKPIDSLLNRIPKSYDSIYTSSATSMFYGARIIVSFSSIDCWLYIFPSTSSYIERVNLKGLRAEIAWPLHNVRKENLGRVTLVDMGLDPILDVE